MDINPDYVRAFFTLGLKISDHINGDKRHGDDGKTDAVYGILKEIAEGDLTLLDTPEEVIAKLPKPPAGTNIKVGPEFYEMMRVSRENERITAKTILEALPG